MPAPSPASGSVAGRPIGPALAAAAVIATLAFSAYSRTLLPGVDLGDTGGFQAAVLWPSISARQAYPLYYSLARPFVGAVSAADPARGLNLFSALWGGIAVGLLTMVIARLTRSILPGIVAGLFLAFSYTWWTQAIIAEVYTLHLALVGACLLALQAYVRQPVTSRLALFCAVYALAFGNHLSMIVLFIPFAAVVIAAHPAPRQLLRAHVIALAAALAVAGALQYAPNFLAVWSGIDAPAAWRDRIAAFWFDTTKADWRESAILGIGANRVGERLAMWGWDAAQQFGVLGLLLAVAGAVRVWFVARIWALGLWLAYGCTTVFAVTYNVGDSHVFFLPSHYFTAAFAGIALSPIPPAGHRRTLQAVPLALAACAIGYAGWRAWDTWPAVDRHDDRRADALVARVTSGADARDAVLVSGMDWQSENALLYSSRWERRNIAWLRLAEVLPHFPFFVRDNQALDRDIVLTTDAAATVLAAYGPLFPLEPIDPPENSRLTTAVARIPRGTPYVLTRLTPTRDVRFDEADYDRAVADLTGGQRPERTESHFQVLAGVAGEAPAYRRASDRPFRESFAILGDTYTARMESWLPDDTFRRAGFGQILYGRQRILMVERGASLVWLTGSGDARVAYAGGLYAPAPRFRISRGTLHLAALPGEH